MHRLLMIDDDKDHIRQVQEYLDEDVYQLEYETDSIEGVRHAREHPPDLIILDIEMEPLDGFGVLERLQDSECTREIPVVIYSIVGEDDRTILLGLGLGVDQTVHKGRPKALRLLEARIRHLLALRQEDATRTSVRRYRVEEHELLIYGEAERVVRDDEDIVLSKFQRGVLAKLADCDDVYVSTEELNQYLYGELVGEESYEYIGHKGRFYRYMNGLRRRIEPDPRNPLFIVSHRDMGYRLCGRTG